MATAENPPPVPESNLPQQDPRGIAVRMAEMRELIAKTRGQAVDEREIERKAIEGYVAEIQLGCVCRPGYRHSQC
jgi:hypothetical protein